MSELTKLFGGGSSASIFAGTPFDPPKPVVVIPPPEVPEVEEESRADRLIFVGNVDISTKRKALKKLFGQFGEIEKVWERSVPVERGKLPIKAAVALKMYKEGASTCNFYVLFKNPEDAKQAITLNGTDFKGSHLRVDFAEQPKKEVRASIFIGNLAYDVKDEELWEEFKEFGDIDYVRVIRDPTTHLGKGFAYVAFKEKDSAKRALSKHNSEFKGRPLRVSKAMEDKQLKKQQDKPRNRRPRWRAQELKDAYELPENYKTQPPQEIMQGRPSKNKKRDSKPDNKMKKSMKKEQAKLKEKTKMRKEVSKKTDASKPTKKSKRE